MAKLATWYGKTEEELKALSQQEFLTLIPSRARRSLKHGQAHAHKKLLEKISRNARNLRTKSRDMIIVPPMLGKTITIHGGKEWVPIIITPDMLGHYLGEFALTRKMVTHGSAGIGATRSSKGVSAK